MKRIMSNRSPASSSKTITTLIQGLRNLACLFPFFRLIITSFLHPPDLFCTFLFSFRLHFFLASSLTISSLFFTLQSSNNPSITALLCPPFKLFIHPRLNFTALHCTLFVTGKWSTLITGNDGSPTTCTGSCGKTPALSTWNRQ